MRKTRRNREEERRKMKTEQAGRWVGERASGWASKPASKKTGERSVGQLEFQVKVSIFCDKFSIPQK